MEVCSTYAAVILLAVCLLASTHVGAAENVRVFSIAKDPPARAHQSGGPVTVMVDVQRSLNSISSHFIGVTIDAGQILLDWSTLNFSSIKVQNMAKALSPSYFRLGGTYADTMTYTLGNDHDPWRAKSYGSARVPEFNLTAKDWDSVYQFSQIAGWDFIMDLNALKRNPDGSWNSDNARQLLKYSADRNFIIAGFELGNEYDVYKQSFNVSVSPRQLARDVAALKALLNQFPAYASSFIIGPETCLDVESFFEGFLAAGGSEVVRAASFHQYYFAAGGSKVPDFVSIKRMDELVERVDHMMGWSRFVDPQLPVWLSETSTAYNSGTPNVSDRFVAGFLWMDKLGVCAYKGIQSVIRQAFYGGHYSLVNADLNPNPDFWLTVLYKRIVRGAVFNATASVSDVRVYAACANTQHYKRGSVALYMLNPNPYPLTLTLPQFSSHPLLVYSLTAGDSMGLLSRYTALNGVKLELVNDNLPNFNPKMMSGDVFMDSYSFMFVVVQDTRSAICMEQP